jgi:hypothetical protein
MLIFLAGDTVTEKPPAYVPASAVPGAGGAGLTNGLDEILTPVHPNGSEWCRSNPAWPSECALIAATPSLPLLLLLLLVSSSKVLPSQLSASLLSLLLGVTSSTASTKPSVASQDCPTYSHGGPRTER